MPTTQELTERLDRLEHQNRNLRRGFWSLLLVGAAVLFIGGAVQNENTDVAFQTIEAKRLAITDNNGKERLVLQLDAGEPALTMLNHESMQQVYLGIDENWSDSAYLSVCSRLENGAIDKQAVLVATTARQPGSGFQKKSVPGNSQLLLCDLAHKPSATSGRHLVRLASGRLDDKKPYFEIREVTEETGEELSFEMLTAKPVDDMGQRFLLDTTPKMTTLSDVKVLQP